MASSALADPSARLLSKCKILSYEEQVECWRRYKENQDQEALEKLIFCYLRMAFSLVDAFNCPQHREELQAEAYYALIKAIDFWDPEKGRLSTIVHPIVVQAITNYLQQANKVIRVPNAARMFYKNVQGTTDAHTLNFKQRTKIEHIAAAENLKRLTPKLLEAIEDGKIEADVVNKSSFNDEIAELHLKLNLLDGRTRFIITHYFGIKEPRYSIKQLKKILNLKTHVIKSSIKLGLMNLQKMGECLYCGKRFQPNVFFKYYCSTLCKQLYLSSLNVQYKECVVCGKLFIPTRKFKKYCSYACKHGIKHSDHVS